MPCENSARNRSKTVAFRMTEKQAEMLDLRVKASGLTKQDYIFAKLMDEEVCVKPSSRLHKALKDIMGGIYAQLLRIRAGEALSEELEHAIALLADEFTDMKPGDAPADIDREAETIWNMGRE